MARNSEWVDVAAAWAAAWIIATFLFGAPWPTAPYVSCIDGHIVKTLADCPPVPHHGGSGGSGGSGGPPIGGGGGGLLGGLLGGIL